MLILSPQDLNPAMSVNVFRFLFYEKYFKETAKELDVPISNFYLPSLRKEDRKKPCEIQENSKFKTVNSKYIKSILSSASFKKDFEKYMDLEFAKEYKREREDKLKHLSVNFNKDKRLTVSFKLPWTECEIVQAKDYFKNFVLRNK